MKHLILALAFVAAFFISGGAQAQSTTVTVTPPSPQNSVPGSDDWLATRYTGQALPPGGATLDITYTPITRANAYQIYHAASQYNTLLIIPATLTDDEIRVDIYADIVSTAVTVSLRPADEVRAPPLPPPTISAGGNSGGGGLTTVSAGATSSLSVSVSYWVRRHDFRDELRRDGLAFVDSAVWSAAQALRYAADCLGHGRFGHGYCDAGAASANIDYAAEELENEARHRFLVSCYAMAHGRGRLRRTGEEVFLEAQGDLADSYIVSSSGEQRRWRLGVGKMNHVALCNRKRGG